MNIRSLLLTVKEREQAIPAFDEALLFALERRYFDLLHIDHLELAVNPSKDVFRSCSDLRLLHISEISYRRGEDRGLHLVNMQNVLASLRDESHNVISIVKGTGPSTELYFGVSRRVNQTQGHENSISTQDYARILAQSLQGNFLGVKSFALTDHETVQNIINPLSSSTNVIALPGIPSLRDRDGDAPFAQGLDRFIEAMRGEHYMLMCIAEPVSIPTVDGMIGNLQLLGSSIHSAVKNTIQKSKGSSDTFNIGMFGMMGQSNAITEGEAWTDTNSSGENHIGLGGVLQAGSGGLGTIIGAGIGTLLCPGIGTAIGAGIGAGVGSAAGGLAAYLSGEPLGTAIGRATSYTRSVANTVGNMTGGGVMGGYARSWNRNIAISTEVLNKRAEYTENLCNHYIKRFQSGKNLGFWNVGLYLMAENQAVHVRAKGLIRSIFAGDETHWEPMRAIEIGPKAIQNYLVNFSNPNYDLLTYGNQKRDVVDSVTVGTKLRVLANRLGIPPLKFASELSQKSVEQQVKQLEELRSIRESASEEDIEKAWDIIKESSLGHPLGPILGGVATPLNTEELSLITNVPRQEVQGISIRESATFGADYNADKGDTISVPIGHITHKRVPLEDTFFSLREENFVKHAFICGVTGSGKTTTVMHILANVKKPFLVIEPTKSEYRRLRDIVPNLRIFTIGDESISPFRLNPFEFEPGCQLLTHLDRLRAVFNAAFPMYASMPYLLEEALIGIYLDKGWNLATSQNRFLEQDSSLELRARFMPTLECLLAKIDDVVANKRYAQQLSQDLSAALRARLSSLLVGSKGLMLNCPRSTPISELLSFNTVLELRSLGDDEEKSFVMGLILTRLVEFRETNHDGVSGLKHLTIVEEAHRLLRNVPEVLSAEVANIRGKAVSTFTDMLAEVRGYGEGIMIVDQIPAKLAPEVIKNTSLKLVHRLLARDDRELVGSTIGLDDSQNKELPFLQAGEAIAHREGLGKPFLLKIPPASNNLPDTYSDQDIRAYMTPYHSEHKWLFWRLPGLEKREALSDVINSIDFRRFDSDLYSGVIGFIATIIIDANHCELIKKWKRLAIDKGFCEDDDVINVVFIWYVNKFFSQVNRAFPNHFDKAVCAQQGIVDIWFSSLNSEDQTCAWRKTWEKLVRPDKPLAPLLRWYITTSQAARRLTDRLKRGNGDENHQRLAVFISQEAQRFILGTTGPSESIAYLEKEMLNAILIGNPDASSIIEDHILWRRKEGCEWR